MALRSEEIDVIKWELGISLLRIGSEPYIAYLAIMDKVIQPYLYDNGTTSSTSVTPGVTTAITIAANLPPPNGVGLSFQVGTVAVVDVGPAQEFVYVMQISGLSLTGTFANAHAAPFPVAPYGTEQVVRDIVTRLGNIKVELQNTAPKTAGVEKVDEVSLTTHAARGRGTVDKFARLIAQRDLAREDLAGVLGLPCLWKAGRGGSVSRTEMY